LRAVSIAPKLSRFSCRRRKPHELLGLMGQREQALAEVDGIAGSSGHGMMRTAPDARDALIRMELIAHKKLTGTIRSSAPATSTVDV